MRQKSINLLFLLIFIFNYSVNSQSTFQKAFGGTGSDYGRTAIRTSDNGFLIVGTIINYTPIISNDIYLIKLDSLCDTIWTKMVGDIGSEQILSAQQTNDGGYIFAGNINMGAGYGDAYMLKTDSLGMPMWAKAYGGTYSDDAYSVQQTFDGGFIMCGRKTTYTGGSGDINVYLIKTDGAGNVIWSKTYGTTDVDMGVYCHELSNGGYVVFGNTHYNDNDILVIRTDMNGDTLWTKAYGRIGKADAITDVYTTANEEFILVGMTEGIVTNAGDAYMIKLNNNGDTLWTKIFSGVNQEILSSVHQTSDGGMIITGSSYNFNPGNSVNDIFLIKTDSLANPNWIINYNSGGSENSDNVLPTNDGGYLITGSHLALGAAPNDWNLLLTKTDSLGTSGCNDSIITFTELSSSTLIGNVNLDISSGCITTNLPINSSAGGVVNDICNTLGVNSIENKIPFSIIPNPSNGSFEIKFENEINIEKLEIYDLSGASIYEQIIGNEFDNKYKLNDTSQGFYFIKITVGNRSYSSKVIIYPD